MTDTVPPFVVIPELDQAREPTALERRVAAAQAVLDRFRDVPFDPGKSDCVQVLIALFRDLGVMPRYGKPIAYKSLLAGRAVLKRQGFASVAEWLDSFLAPITPAMALPGDILELEAEEGEAMRGLGAFVVYLGNAAVLGYHEIAVGGCVMRIGDGVSPLRAWRTIA